MSKPNPIEFTLASWSIEYESQYFESDRIGTYHYMAHITWVASKSDIKSLKTPLTHTEQKLFTGFELAKEWIDQELKS